jgi:PhnB protein
MFGNHDTSEEVAYDARRPSFTTDWRTTMTNPIPEGYNTVTPYLAVDDAAQAIEYYKRAFGAKEVGRMAGPDGKIAHAELEIGDSKVMLSDPFPQFSTRPPKELGATSVSVFMYVEDVDAVVQQAVDAGGTMEMEVADQFWGDRFGSVTDPFGHVWSIATHVEDVPPEEMEQRAKAAMAAMSS